MKKSTIIISLIAAAALSLSLTACSSGETSSAADSGSSVQSEASAENTASAPSDITAKIQADIKFPSMAEIKSDRMSDYYDFDAEKIESFSAFICGSGAYPDELAVFKLKSADDTAALKTVLEGRVELQTKTFENYTPDEMYKIDGKNVVVSGQYVALIICSDNSAATAVFNDMTK